MHDNNIATLRIFLILTNVIITAFGNDAILNVQITV